jgi:hypothetical protein
MSLSLGTAWTESAALARRAPAPLFAIAFLLIALPAAILQALAPVTAPGRLPEPGLWLLPVPVAAAAGLVGALAICRLALDPAETAAGALGAGLRRLLPLLGAALLVAAAGALLIAGSLVAAAAIGLPLLLLLPLTVLLFVWVRLILLTPAAAGETLGPIALLRRAWALSAGRFFPLLGILLATAVLSLIAMMAAGAIGGLAARLAPGQPQPGIAVLLLVLLISALLQAAIGSLFTAFLARLYAQLAER